MDAKNGKKPALIKINPADNVKMVVREKGLQAGTRVEKDLEIKEDIPQGHKVAVKNIKKGAEIIKYGKTIGYAASELEEGSWIKEERVQLPAPPPLANLEYGTHIKNLAPVTGYTFSGYKNRDGTVGTKNMLGLIASVQCVEGVLNQAVEKIREELLPQYPGVEGVVPINHNYGCGVAIDAPEAEIPIRTLKNLASNPNLGEVIVVGLGCEKLPPSRLFPHNKDKEVIMLQKENGYKEMEQKILKKSEAALQRLQQRERKTCPASDLIVGLQCGGSDAFSGITANPALGYAADLLVKAGATVIFSEVSEIRDGVAQLSSRIKDKNVFDKFKKEINWYDNYLKSGKVDRDANPSPGNKAGGLANVVEKALGSIEKSGSAPIEEVLGPGEKVSRQGLVFAATPASDFVCGTLQLAAGINLQVFSTGRGTPYGLEMVPVIKVSSRTELQQQWSDLIDIDAGKIASGKRSYQETGQEILEMILQVAGGKEESRADHWQIKNRMCLFNPGVIT